MRCKTGSCESRLDPFVGGETVNDLDERTSADGATCLLWMNDRVVLRASSSPTTEYAMFDLGEIELRTSEPGRIREHGYKTTVEQARARLASFGITAEAARDVALAMQPILADAYARGGAVRHIARYLGPLELFQSDAYDGPTHSYLGVFLDLASLANDLDLEHASGTIRALYLASLLETETTTTSVRLSTDALTKSGMPAARTYRRPTFTDLQTLVYALGRLSNAKPRPDGKDVLPRQDVIAFLRSRADVARDDDSRALYKSLEGSLSLRDIPAQGPLAAPDLWAIEMRLEAGELGGTLEALDEAERHHGRTIGTTYLRARASLAMRLEPAKLIAERVSTLALSTPSFAELSLLAAESWLDARDPRRALPYAREVVESSIEDEALALRAQRLLARAVGAAPPRRDTLVDGIQAAQPSRPPLGPSTVEPAIASDPPLSSKGAVHRRSVRPRLTGVTEETRPPVSFDPRAEPDSVEIPPEPRLPTTSNEPLTSATSPVLASSSFPPPGERTMMHGASLPPYRLEPFAPPLAKIPTFVDIIGADDELAEHLTLPPGLGEKTPSLDVLPTSIVEARITFTLLARELGRDYRMKRGIGLRTDVRGIESMQAVLLESFPYPVVKTAEDAYDLLRHGALMSEILARRLGAKWLDIAPSKLGYWAMVVPPVTRIWPFGRLARLVTMGHKERDLVSYFLELQSRAGDF